MLLYFYTMKLLLLILILVPIISFGQLIPKENNPIFGSRGINTKRLDYINGRPTSQYLNNPTISFYAKAFYQGQFCMYDNDEFFSLMDSVLTNNNSTRPFYFYILNRIVELSDGAVSEVASEYCKNYIAKYPCEFLNYCNKKEFAIPLDTWTMFVGFMFDSTKDCEDWLQAIDKKIAVGCPQLQQQWDKLKPGIRTSINE